MSLPECPKLRGLLAASPNETNQSYVIWDQLRLTNAEILITPAELECLKLFDGRRTLRDIQAAVMQLIGGLLLPIELIERLVHACTRWNSLMGLFASPAACAATMPILAFCGGNSTACSPGLAVLVCRANRTPTATCAPP